MKKRGKQLIAISICLSSMLSWQVSWASDRVNNKLVDFAFNQCNSQNSLLKACDKALNSSIDSGKAKNDVINKQQELLKVYEEDKLKREKEDKYFWNSKTFWFIFGGVAGGALYKGLKR